ncbi:MAG TPA: glycosyltransferase family 39 protein [Puia sp.]|jgi:4-amino-4-deoxy-L-arabinose transferase-like glycosyltransferase|nr:glycosyltransferase family 39 protein [Puia sp.]
MQKLNRLLYLLALIKFTLPFFLQNPVYEPHRDELLYLAEGSHPAFGFMEVPPMLSIFAWITQHLGNSMFWIKCWPSLIGALNLILIGKIVISEGGKSFSLLLLFCCFFFTAYLRVHFLFQPNCLEIFFYSFISFGLVRYIQTSENKWLYLTGVGAGFGLLSKYSVAFYIISLLPALLLTKQRIIFRNKHLYYSLGLAFVIFLPNLIWQILHHFPLLYHMHELASTQLQYLSPADFLKDQLLMFLPCCYIWITGFFYLLLNPKGRAYLFLCWAYLGVIAILLWFHGKNYYALGLYPVLFGFGSLAIEQWTIRSRFLLRYIFTGLTVLSGIYFIFIALPVMAPKKLAAFYEKTHAKGTGFLKWEDQRDHLLPQDFADMQGWDEMAQKTAAAFHSLDSVQQRNTFIFCDNYGMAGAINYYRKKYHLPEAYSDNASFLYWIPDTLTFQNFILLESDPNEMQYPFIKDFSKATLTDSVTNPYARENGTAIVLLVGANEKFKKFFTDKIRSDQRKTQGY